MTPGFRVPQTPVTLDESSRKRKAEEEPQSTGRKFEGGMAQETEDGKRKFDDDKAAQSKQEDRELAGEDHGVKRSAEELGERPKSERMYPPTCWKCEAGEERIRWRRARDADQRCLQRRRSRQGGNTE